MSPNEKRLFGKIESLTIEIKDQYPLIETGAALLLAAQMIIIDRIEQSMED